jgi:hypothetical protein
MPSKKGIYIFTVIGLVLGIILDQLVSNTNTNVFYYSVITLFSILYALAYNEQHLLRLAGTSFILALFLSSPLLPLNANYSSEHYLHLLTFLLGFPFFVYVVHSFHYACQHDNTWRVNYSSLFAAVWNTIPLLFVAGLFCALANMIILLGASIFKTVGSEYLWNLYFYNHHFSIISNSTLFFIGLAIGQENIKIIYSLRFVMLRIMYYLFPFLALHSVIYFIMYNIHYFSGEKDYINPLFILIPLTALGLIFFNACYQDGTIELKYPRWIKGFLKIYRVVLFILIMMMSYKIFQDYSLDINLCIYLLVTILFSINYAITAWFSVEKEKKWIRIGNISTGLVFIVALYLTNLPYIPINLTIGVNNPSSIPFSSLFKGYL